MKDFFISYTEADREYAEWIAWQLEDAGYEVAIQAWDFHPGDNFVLTMKKAAAECERTLAVLSPDYLDSMYAQAEWAAAFAADPTGALGTLIPVRVRRCELRGLDKPVVYIDLVDRGERAAKSRLLRGIKRERGKPAKPPEFPSSGPADPPSFPGVKAPAARRSSWKDRTKSWMNWTLALLAIVVGVAAWRFPVHLQEPEDPAPAIYALRVQVLDPAGNPVEGAMVRASAGNEPQLLPDGWWELEIPAGKTPDSGEVTIYATHDAWTSVSEAVILSSDHNPQVALRLAPPLSTVAGMVIDDHEEPIAGATVSIISLSSSPQTTGVDGRFDFELSVARGERVRLRVEHIDFAPKEAYCVSGSGNCSLIVERDHS